MGQAREAEDGLREILLRAEDDRVAFLAAYHLASSLRKQSRFERSLSYARRAMELAPDRYRQEGEKLIDKLTVYHFGCLNVFAAENGRSNTDGYGAESTTRPSVSRLAPAAH